jgi:drug/metabolite transporter (DMT)-like permease
VLEADVASPDNPARIALVPAIVAATAFAVADVSTKVTLNAEAGVLTMGLFRGLIGVPLLVGWLFVGTRPITLSRAQRNLALLVGVLFAANVYFLFEAFARMDVPVTVLVYFTYPLFTGLAAAATRLEPLGLAGALAALVAFCGLALIVGANPAGLAVAGIAFALLASLSRVVILLITRARLGDADPRLISVWSMIAASAAFASASLITAHWQPPVTALGWYALIAASVGMVIAVLAVFISTARIGPFRTALFMNLEPLLATIGAGVFLGEVITPLQALGGAIMIGALVAFQLRR